jgi:IS5 family transposase
LQTIITETKFNSQNRSRELDRPSRVIFLSSLLNVSHPLVQLATTLDWECITSRFDAAHKRTFGAAELPRRVFVGLMLLRELYDLSEEQLHRQWKENPYFQYFCGFNEFQHGAPFDPILMRLSPRIASANLRKIIEETYAAASPNTPAPFSDESSSQQRSQLKSAPKKQNRANIYDVAREAGVSIKTVSLVLNKHSNVSARARSAVSEAIEALNYKPSSAARRLARRRS